MTTVPETRSTGPRAGSASFVLVTGPSGAGRSTAVRALEDMGCETIDNLPLSLIPRLSEGGALLRPLILGIDVRNRDFSVAAFLDTVDWLRRQGAAVEVLYLDCAPDVLTRRYSDSYLQNPQVTVFVKEFASQRITLEGAVRQPGIYPLTGRTTLLQSIAIAQGLDPLADLGGVVLFRQVDGKKMAAVYDIRELRKGKVEDPLLYGEDIVVVEQSGSKTALRRFIESVPAVGLFMAPF